MPPRTLVRGFALAASCALLVVACGDDGGAVDPGEPVSAITIRSDGLDFDVEAFAVRAGEEVEVTYENADDGTPHNVHFEAPGEAATGVRSGPDTQTLTLRVDQPGEYTYVCDAHVAQMRGTLVVE